MTCIRVLAVFALGVSNMPRGKAIGGGVGKDETKAAGSNAPPPRPPLPLPILIPAYYLKISAL